MVVEKVFFGINVAQHSAIPPHLSESENTFLLYFGPLYVDSKEELEAIEVTRIIINIMIRSK